MVLMTAVLVVASKTVFKITLEWVPPMDLIEFIMMLKDTRVKRTLKLKKRKLMPWMMDDGEPFGDLVKIKENER